MNRFTTWLPTSIQRLLTVLLLSITLLIGTGMQASAQPLLLESGGYQAGDGNSANERTFGWYQDQKPLKSFMREADVDRPGETTTPTSDAYRNRGNDAPTIDLDNKQARRTQQKLKNAADNVREKLNLDDVQDRASDTVKGTQRTLKRAADTVINDR